MKQAMVIGGGPAGLMAAEQLAQAGHAVTLAEAKPSVGRKFLMAGKSGLNLTRDEPTDALLTAYGKAANWLHPMISEFDAAQVQEWARRLEQDLFTGSTGRVFPKAMKASPLLRAWLARLDRLDVNRRTRWRWTGWQGRALQFSTPDGPVSANPDVTILALGGASWARLGSDGNWLQTLIEQGIHVAPFEPANVGVAVQWSAHMERHFGQPVKNTAFRAGALISRGEAVISARGLEGGGIYAVAKALREGAALCVDLQPDMGRSDLTSRLSRARGKTSLANHLRKQLKLGPIRTAMLQGVWPDRFLPPLRIWRL